MEQSLFIEWVNKYFPGITIRVVETLNDTNRALTYLHRSMLRKEYSATGKWQALTVQNQYITADYVAMDSELPLKARASSGKATGEIPKVGMELWLNESQLTELDILVAQNATDDTIVAKLFQDTATAITGVYELNEGTFLEGLSTGVVLIQDTDDAGKNVGTGIRLDYQYLAENKFGASTAWSDSEAKPFTDIEQILEKAQTDGNVITVIMVDRKYFNYIAKTQEAKDLYAAQVGIFTGTVPIPSFSQLNAAIKDRYGFVFQIVDRSIRKQVNGTNSNYKPWKEGSVIALTTLQVGSLVYARLAEQNHPVEGVSYQTVDDYILVSKYRKNSPLSEYTSSQSRVVPVINNVNQIYLLDATANDAGLPPTVDAGADQTSSTVTHVMSGASATADGDKTITNLKWSKVSGPAGSTIASGQGTLTPTIGGLVTGVYVYRLTATDSEGLQTAQDVTITATVA